MKNFILIAALASVALPAFSQVVAECGPLKGHSYFPNAGMVPANKAGWQPDGISGGTVTLQRLSSGDLDIIFTDANRKQVSTVNDGGKVYLTRANPTDISAVVIYPGVTEEIYSFWQTTSGALEFSMLQSKGGRAAIHKKTAMVGRCQQINFSVVK